MDYKELIRISKKAANEWRGNHEYHQAGILVDSLCEAMETLLAEQDVAVEMMRGKCCFCKHQRDCGEDAQYVAECSNGTDWEFRGLQDRTK